MDTSTIIAQVTLAFIGAAVGGMVRQLLGLYMAPWGCTIEVVPSRRLGEEPPAAAGIALVSSATAVTTRTTTTVAQVATEAASPSVVSASEGGSSITMPAEIIFRSQLELEVKTGEEEERTPVESAAPGETPNYQPPPSSHAHHHPGLHHPHATAAPATATNLDAARGLSASAAVSAEDQSCVKEGTIHSFPSATFVVNIVGCFILGLLTQLSLKLSWPPYVLAALGTGFCGGLTTFSTFIIDTYKLIYSGNGSTAALYFCITNIACLLTGWIGWLLGSLAG
jgi:fluoride exporter